MFRNIAQWFSDGFRFYPQLETMDCGPACVRMIAAAHERFYSLEVLKNLCDFNKLGTNFQSLSRCLQETGFETTVVTIPFQSTDPDTPGLTECPLPVIVHWNQRHFVVVYHIGEKQIKIADPAQGKVTLTVQEFRESWEELLAMPDKENIPVQQSNTEKEKKSRLARFVVPYLRPFTRVFIAILISMAAMSALQFIIPYLNQRLVDEGIANKNIAFIQTMLAGLLMVFAGRATIEIIQNWLFLNAGTRINNSMLYDFLKKILHLPVRFFDQRTKGDLMQRMQEFSRLEQFITTQFVTAIVSSLVLIVFAVVLFRYNLVVFYIFSGAAVLYTIWILLFLRKRSLLDYRMFNRFATQQNNLYEMLEGVQDIKVNNLESDKYNKWKLEQDQLFTLQRKNFSVEQWQRTGASFISQVKDILITFYAANAVVNGQITFGAMLAIQYIIGQMNLPLNQLVYFTQELQNAINSMRRINEVFLKETETTAGDTVAATGANFQEHTLQLQDVSFEYESQRQVLSNITASIRPGTTTAIVGASGSGKSTLLRLLMRFYEPASGSITIGTVPLQAIQLKEWRAHCAVVLQNGFIFSDSLLYNICLGQNRGEAFLQQVIEDARLGDVISRLPQGLLTKIGEEGMQLSQGQQQRVLIGRALFKNTPLLLLDEATNSLDAINEGKILEGLQKRYQGKTTIIVAHRLSTIRKADQILLLHNGSIAEAGTHAELMQRNELYAALVAQQTGEEKKNPVNQ
ncbi:MAG: peptidase domain-containing ABC transporter [Bacteroidetes bacterium]|nr:peptidase domain-containing ABC transporter [Bacteroidota bacterium]